MIIHRLTATTTLLTALALVPACTDDYPEDDGGYYITASGTGSGTGNGSTGGDATEDPGTTSATSSGPETGDSGSSSGGSEESSTTDPGSPGLEEACQAYCDVLTMCFPDEPPPPDCVGLCVEEGSEVGTAECGEAIVDFYSCLGGLSCEQLQGERPVCVEEELALDEVCSDGECFVGVGGGETECAYTESCPDVDLEMSCDTETCTCLENGVEVGSCDAMGVCAEGFGMLAEYATTCCGFV